MNKINQYDTKRVLLASVFAVIFFYLVLGWVGIVVAFIIICLLLMQKRKPGYNQADIDKKNMLFLKKILLYFFLPLFIIVVVAYVVGSNSLNASKTNADGFTSSENGKIQVQPTQIQTFKVGETATDGKIKVTINSIKYTKEINELGSHVFKINASDNKKYLIVDITIENLQSRKLSLGMFNTEVHSKEGYVSKQEAGIQLNYLANPLPWGDSAYILPNSKVRGDVVYEISDNAQDLKLLFTYNDYDIADGYEWLLTFDINQ